MRLVLLVLIAAVLGVARSGHATDIYDEKYRPQFHFSAKKGWLNDPNGLIYSDGQYHMFYQHNPFGEQWGNMTWGHATSPNLVHWTERSPALAADSTGVKFSGTAVIDHNNSAGLQTGANPTMALFYTSVGAFDQRMTYSNDNGRSFRYHDDNPVLPNISGQLEDRDPQVFWHEDTQKWVQGLWVPSYDGKPAGFQFYGSQNLTDWSFLSETPGFHECPDMFELPVDGDPNNTRWVLYGAPANKYQVGTFDGTSFASLEGNQIQDYGNTFYAAQSFHNVPSDDGRRLQVTWMNGGNFPGMPFNQQMGFPAELTLHDTDEGIRMFRNPAEEIELLHETEHSVNNVVFSPGQDPLGSLSGDLFHIQADIELNSADTVGFNIRGHEVLYDVNTQTLSALGRSAPLAPVNGRVQLELLVDRTSIELFGGNGRVSMTSSFLPSQGNTEIDLFATGGNARVVSLSAFELASAWPTESPKPSEGLLGHWTFDEPTRAANFINNAGTEFDLANSGVVSGESGLVGQAARIDNSADHIYMPNHTGINAESFTVSFWFDPESSGSKRSIISKTHEEIGTWGVEKLADGRLNFFVTSEDNSMDNVESNTALEVNEWNHAVASYDADTGRLELYLNGNFAGASELQIEGSPLFDDSPLMIGRRRIGSTLNATKGAMDDLQIYGTALTPGQIGHLYQNPGDAIEPGSFDPSSLKLVIDPQTGSASILNADGASISIKGYSILSTTGALDANGWESLASSSNPLHAGWDEANPNGSTLSELNPTGDLLVGASTVLDLGNPFAAQGILPFGTRASNTDMSFQYTTADGQVLNGLVEIAGGLGVNNLLLEVDPDTGIAMLSNSSPHAVRVSAYSILSESGALQPDNGDWLSLADQSVTDADEANPSDTDLSEFLNAFNGGLLLQPGQSYMLGEIFKSLVEGGEKDLELEFILSEFLPLDGDYNADGVVDAADYTVWRDAYGTSTTLPNEGTTPGVVTDEDYIVWRDNYGSIASVDVTMMNGVVRYGGLATVSGIANTSVPEPHSATLIGLAFMLMGSHSRRNLRP